MNAHYVVASNGGQQQQTQPTSISYTGDKTTLAQSPSSAMYQRQSTSPDLRVTRQQQQQKWNQNQMVSVGTKPTTRMSGFHNATSSGDMLAPDLSDLEFEIGNTGKQPSPGAAWSTADHLNNEAHLMSPVNQAGLGSCTKSISLLNAMQTCDMAAGNNQKTSSYRPIKAKLPTTTSSGGAAQMPTRNPPKPPSRSSSSEQSKTIDLNTEEIFEISV